MEYDDEGLRLTDQQRPRDADAILASPPDFRRHSLRRRPIRQQLPKPKRPQEAGANWHRFTGGQTGNDTQAGESGQADPAAQYVNDPKAIQSLLQQLNKLQTDLQKVSGERDGLSRNSRKPNAHN
jgi:hypothetical protein